MKECEGMSAVLEDLIRGFITFFVVIEAEEEVHETGVSDLVEEGLEWG